METRLEIRTLFHRNLTRQALELDAKFSKKQENCICFLENLASNSKACSTVSMAKKRPPPNGAQTQTLFCLNFLTARWKYVTSVGMQINDSL